MSGHAVEAVFKHKLGGLIALGDHEDPTQIPQIKHRMGRIFSEEKKECGEPHDAAATCNFLMPASIGTGLRQNPDKGIFPYVIKIPWYVADIKWKL